MTIPVFQREVEDGLADLIASSASIAYDSSVSLFKPAESKFSFASLKHPDLAIANKDDQWDLNWMASILVSVGWNKNDDIFTPEDTWAARHSPDHKYINFMHNEKDIIGHMVASTVLDYDGNLIPDNSETIPKEFEIAVNGVLYAKWSDPILQARMDDIIAGIAENKWFVSMECLFPNFDYGVISPEGEHKIIRRTEASSFLTKHLRIYGGSGKFEGHTIGRLLRNLTFSGKGIVNNPANPRSLILNSKAFEATEEDDNNLLISYEEKDIMAENALDDVKAMLVESKAREQKLADKLEEKVAEAQKSEREKFEGTIASLKVDVSDLEVEKVAKAAELTTKDEELTKAAKELKTAQAKIEELEASVAKVEGEKVVANRTSMLVEAGLTAEAAGEVVETWAGSSDEQFADVVKLHVTANKDNPFTKDGDKDKDKDKDKKDKADADVDVDDNDDKAAADVDGADIDEDADLHVTASNNKDELHKAVSSWFESNLNVGKQSK